MLDPIQAILMAMTPYKLDHEEPAERRDRMAIIAQAIDEAAERATCRASDTCHPVIGDRRLAVALLLEVGSHESHFAKYVHENRCSEGPDHCDADRNGEARARSPWQLWRVAVNPTNDWDRIGGADLDSTRLAAWHAVVRLAGSRAKCQELYSDPIQSMIAGYAGGCLRLSKDVVIGRAANVRRFMSKL